MSIISDFYRGKVAELIAHWNYVEVFSAKQKIVWPSGTMGCGASNVKNVHKTVHCKLPDGKLVSVSNNTCKQHVALYWPARQLSPIIKLIPGFADSSTLCCKFTAVSYCCVLCAYRCKYRTTKRKKQCPMLYCQQVERPKSKWIEYIAVAIWLQLYYNYLSNSTTMNTHTHKLRELITHTRVDCIVD